MALVAAATLLHTAYAVRTLLAAPVAKSPLAALAGGGEVPAPDLSQSKRIKVMADYYTHPLWALDDDHYGDIAPEALGLSPELTGDLNDWAEEFTNALDPDDPAVSRWSEEQHAAHEARGRGLAVRLAREMPDRMIYVLDKSVGVVEVHADDPA